MNNPVIALVGNPNSGKTTLFNQLTGSKQKVGNWPGVTVERKSGFYTFQNTSIEVVDLPGTYSLSNSKNASMDECIACDFILKRQADLIINIIDASNLERNLYLTTQLLEMHIPVIIAVNMMDVARNRGFTISLDELSKQLGCKVVSLEAHKNKGIKELKTVIQATLLKKNIPSSPIIYADSIEQEILKIRKNLSESDSRFMATRFIEENACTYNIEDADILIADARYQFIQTILNKCLQKNSQNTITWTERIDRIVLNRFLGIPIFLGMMYLMFLFSMNVAGGLQDFFDITSDTIFVQGFAQVLTLLKLPAWLIAILANGVGKGINTVASFIPVIGGMFLFLAFLEDSGYMARAAFVVDRVMRAMGLPGKSFVPMIVGFGCNVPAIMATRTLDNNRDRILTIMMSPFMSCSARLAIYAVFTAAFFPSGGHNIVFALYVIGIVMAMLTGLLLRKTVLQGESAPLILELPPYHVPRLKTLSIHAWHRLKSFVFRAGKLIVPICILIGVLNVINLDGTLNSGEGDMHSLLSYVGKIFTPIFKPMGITENNWPATVGLVTGILAKEVVVGTLNTLYSQLAHVNLTPEGFNFWQGLLTALKTIPDNLSQVIHSLSNPVLAKAPIRDLSQSVYGIMYQRFDGKIGAIAYLLFVLLYFPCISTTAVMTRELNKGWTIFSVLWTTGLAYCVAVLFYQIATFQQHLYVSLSWVIAITFIIITTITGIRSYAKPI